jgi:hypothetical protein
MKLNIDIQHNSIECHYAECRNYLNVMLSVVMLSVVMLSVVTLNVIRLSVVRLNVIMLSVEALFSVFNSLLPWPKIVSQEKYELIQFCFNILNFLLHSLSYLFVTYPSQ